MPLNEDKSTALFITRNLPPLLGGMERLNYKIALALDESLTLIVIGPLGCKNKMPGSASVLEVPPKPIWRFLLASGFKAFGISMRKKPGFVIAGSGLTAPLAWTAARLAGARSAAYLHGLDIIANHPIYRFIWTPFFRRMDTIIVNSRNTAKLAIKAGVSAKHLTIINPGTEMPFSGPEEANAFRKKYKLDKRPLLLSVGRLTRRKGLAQFVENVLPGLVKSYPDICLVIVGDEAPDALTGSGEGGGDRLDRMAIQLGISRNLVRLGTCNDAQLSAAYSAADVHVFPVLEIPGDIEGFGMVALEAAAHGLPTVAFRVGGVPDAVSQGVSGYLVSPGDYHAMQNRVEDILEKDSRGISPKACREFVAEHTWTVFNKQLKSTFGID